MKNILFIKIFLIFVLILMFGIFFGSHRVDASSNNCSANTECISVKSHLSNGFYQFSLEWDNSSKCSDGYPVIQNVIRYRKVGQDWDMGNYRSMDSTSYNMPQLFPAGSYEFSIKLNPQSSKSVTITVPCDISCSSAGPDNDIVLNSASTRRVYAYGVSASVEHVLFPTWTAYGGQDDLIWYPGVNDGDGTWHADISLASHNGTGQAYTHVYLYDHGWDPVFCDYANFSIVSPPATASCSVTPNTLPNGSNPGITLSSTNSIYCIVSNDWVTKLNEGYFTSGTFYPGAQTTPGTHTAQVRCYNADWVDNLNTCTYNIACPLPMNESQTLSCQTGYSGSITQARVKDSSSCAWGGWTTTSNTCTLNSCTNGATNPPTCNNCPTGSVLVNGVCTPITVSVTAPTTYNTTPLTSVPFSYTSSTNSGSTECQLLDSNSSALTNYSSANPISYASPGAIGSFGYYIRCRNTSYTSAQATTGRIIVNTSCPTGTDFVSGQCRTRPTITATQTSNGTISPSGVTTLTYGGEQTYTISANSGYNIASLIIDGVSKTVVASYTFSNVTANHTISATFTPSACTNGATNPLTCDTCPSGAYLIGGVCRTVTVSVTASPLTYNTTPSTNISFSYTSSTNYSATECKLLDYNLSSLTNYQTNSPIVHPAPTTTGGFGYYIQCRNSTYNSVFDTSTKITVNVNAGLSVTKNGNGTGTVTSNPSGINCGSTCYYDFGGSGQVMLTATPNSDSTFSSWGGSCSGNSTCTLTMNLPRSVTATFVKNPVDGDCGFESNGYENGKQYASTSTPFDTNNFCKTGNLSLDGITPYIGTPAFPTKGSPSTWYCLGTNGGYTPMCSASIMANKFNVYVSKDPEAGGVIQSLQDNRYDYIINCEYDGINCSGSYDEGTKLMLQARPASSYWKVERWIVSNNPIVDEDNVIDTNECHGQSHICTITVDSTKYVRADFELRKFDYQEF